MKKKMKKLIILKIQKKKGEFKEENENEILKIKKTNQKIQFNKSQKIRKDEKNGEETYKITEKVINKDSINDNIIQQKNQYSNYNLLDIFSTTNLENKNNLLNDNNIIGEAKILNLQNFPEFDFTDPNIPQNKERLEKEKKLDDLKRALNGLNASFKYQNINDLNSGYNTINQINYNSPILLQNGHNGMRKNYMYNILAKDKNYSNINSFPFNNLDFQKSNNNFIMQIQDINNNSFPFI